MTWLKVLIEFRIACASWVTSSIIRTKLRFCLFWTLHHFVKMVWSSKLVLLRIRCTHQYIGIMAFYNEKLFITPILDFKLILQNGVMFKYRVILGIAPFFNLGPFEHRDLGLGTWDLAFGTWHLALGTWHLALGTWHLALDTWDLAPSDHWLLP